MNIILCNPVSSGNATSAVLAIYILSEGDDVQGMKSSFLLPASFRPHFLYVKVRSRYSWTSSFKTQPESRAKLNMGESVCRGGKICEGGSASGAQGVG